MYPCYHKQNWTEVRAHNELYKPERRAEKRGEILASQVQGGTTSSTYTLKQELSFGSSDLICRTDTSVCRAVF